VSNALGIAAVTAVLKDMLNNRVIGATTGEVDVTARSPDKIKTDGSEKTQLNLFLYQVTPNAGWRNVGQPSVGSDGASRLSNPPLALDLHYMLTAYSNEDLKAEVLLGYAMQAMHETPVLTRRMIRDHFVPVGVPPPPFKSLVAAELADQVELIKISLQSLSAEEISKLWTAFGAHYRPTAAYQATVVLIEGRRPTKVALPVQKRFLYARTLREPVIDILQSEAGPEKPIIPTSKLVLLGRRLVGDDTEVLVSGIKTTIDPAATDTRLVADLPAGLRAGVQAVQVKHRFPLGDPPAKSYRGFESNVAPFVLRPTFASLTLKPKPTPGGTTAYKGEASFIVTPPVGHAQRIMLMLNSKTTTPAAYAYAFLASPRSGDADPIVVALDGVERGDYFVRIQVDGAESPVHLSWPSTTGVTI
jgi:hypothetical protein